MNENSMIEPVLQKRTFVKRFSYFFARIGIKLSRAFKRKATYVEIVCALLIILFLYTGVNKLWEYSNFKLQMGRSPFIENWNNLIAATLPAGEILLSLLLVIPKTRLLGLYLSFGLMAMFTGYIWLMLNYAPDLPCSCGGILAEMTWKDHLYFNTGYTLLTMIGIILQSRIRQALS